MQITDREAGTLAIALADGRREIAVIKPRFVI